MQKISILRATSGMILDAPAENENGMVIAGAGTVLDDRIIATLKQFKVAKIQVKGSPLDLPEKEKKTKSGLLQELEFRFSIYGISPEMKTIKEVFIDKIKEMKEGQE